LPHLPQDRQAVPPWQPKVEDDQVPFRRRHGMTRRYAIRDVFNDKSFLAETANDEVGNLGIILDYQETHGLVPFKPAAVARRTPRHNILPAFDKGKMSER
jgi:hypothetical protein